MDVYEAVVSRLAMLGYQVTEQDKPAIDYLTSKCRVALLASIHHKDVPDGLIYTLVDMVAGSFLQDNAECYAVADRLTAVLGSITTPEGDVVHATSCEWTITGGVLHVLVTYDHFVRVPQEHIMMETLKIEQEG